MQNLLHPGGARLRGRGDQHIGGTVLKVGKDPGVVQQMRVTPKCDGYNIVDLSWPSFGHPRRLPKGDRVVSESASSNEGA